MQAHKKQESTKNTNTIDHSVTSNPKTAFKNSVRSKADLQNQEISHAQTMNMAQTSNVTAQATQSNFKQSTIAHQDTTKGKSSVG